MNRIASWCWVSLLLAPLAALHVGDAPQSVSTTANPLDPLASIAGRMKNGICVGHFDHDQDKAPAAAVNAEYLDSVKSAGFKSIRFFYTTDKTPAFYAANVSYALKNGLVVNLCMFAWEHNTKTKEAFAGHWKAIAEYYKDYPDELVFEMFNEPALSPKLKNDPAVMEWVDAGIAAIRAVSPQRIVLVGGPQFMQAEFLVKYVTPDFLTYKLPDGTGFAQDKYIMGACHMYEPWMYTMPKGKRVTLDDLPDWKNQVIGKLDLAAEWAKKWNKPVVVTEWASQSAPKVRADFLAYTQFVVAEMSKRGLGWTYYCGIPSSFLGEDMLWSILDTEYGWDQDVLDILTGVKAPPVPSLNQIRNSEFVPGFTALGDWGLSAWGTSSNAAVSLVPNAFLSGQNALKITLGNEEISIFQDTTTTLPAKPKGSHAPLKPTLRLRSGNTYVLTFIARAEQPGVAVTVRLENASDNGALSFASKPFSLDRQKQEYSCEYMHSGDDVSNARVRLLFSGENTTAFVDKVVMKSYRDTRKNEAASQAAVKPYTLTEFNGRLCLLAPARAEEKPEPPKPASRTVRNIEGWTVRVDDRLLHGPDEATGARALKLLEAQLAQIKSVVAQDRLAKLQALTIVLYLTHGKLCPMQYHPDAGWLESHGYARDLVKCVHIPDVADFVSPRHNNEQPWVVLHELAHSYHDQVLGFNDARILKAWERYKGSGHGDSVLSISGKRKRHYALTDQKEFFAEMSEAYFGMNDFFPFNRAELKVEEPEIFELLQTIWGPVAASNKPAQAKAP